jgi:hypothetical protein
MEAIVATLLLGVLMIGALSLLARTWPRSSSLGGYAARSRGRKAADPGLTEERGEAIREDDDLRWRWTGPRDDPRGGGPTPPA